MVLISFFLRFKCNLNYFAFALDIQTTKCLIFLFFFWVQKHCRKTNQFFLSTTEYLSAKNLSKRTSNSFRPSKPLRCHVQNCMILTHFDSFLTHCEVVHNCSHTVTQKIQQLAITCCVLSSIWRETYYLCIYN